MLEGGTGYAHIFMFSLSMQSSSKW